MVNYACVGGLLLPAAPAEQIAAASDPEAEGLLLGFLKDPKSSPLPPQRVVSLLRFFPKQAASLREHLDSQTPEIRAAAIYALAADSDSADRRRAIASDATVANETRLAAIRSLIHRTPAAATPSYIFL